MVLFNMPVRRIPNSHTSVTGKRFIRDGHKFVSSESKLESDFIALTRFEYPEAKIEEQPVRIEYTDEDGKRRKYTPDFLVTREGQQTLLVEVKPSGRVAEIPASKIWAASDYAEQRKWTFEIWTERKIRGPKLENAHFLHIFRDIDINTEVKELIIETISSLQSIKLQSLLEALWSSAEDRGPGLPVIWALVADRTIVCDLDAKLSPQTILRLAR